MYIGKNNFYCKSVRKSINIDLQGKTIKATNLHKNQPIDTASRCHHYFMKPVNEQTVQTHKKTTEQTLSAAKRK